MDRLTGPTSRRPFPPSRRACGRAVALLACVSIGAFGCSGTSDRSSGAGTSVPATTAFGANVTTTTARGPASTLVVTDPRQPVDAEVGQVIAFRVEANTNSDATWNIQSYDQSALFDIGSAPAPPAESPTGTKPMEDLLFRALRTGATSVVLRYGRAGQAAPSDPTVTIAVTVHD